MTPALRIQTVWPTRSRTGSGFVKELTTAFTGEQLPQARVNGYRVDTWEKESKIGIFRSMLLEGHGLDYLAENGVRSMKYEDPGKDDFILELAQAAPNARFVASHRRIEAVIESHFNITTWGHDEADVLHQFSSCAHLYESLAAMGRLYLINVDEPSSFDAGEFAEFLGVKQIPAEAQRLADAWAPINVLRDQLERSGGVYVGRSSPPRIERLREIHDWIPACEARYERLWRRSGTAEPASGPSSSTS